MRRVAQFGTIFTILKKVENAHRGVLLLAPATLLKVTLLCGCFSHFLIARMVLNREKHHIFVSGAYNSRELICKYS